MIFEGNGQQYKVGMSGNTRSELDKLLFKAVLADKGEQFVNAYQQIIRRLHQDPTVFGEPLYMLAKLELQMRHGAILPLLVDYGVHATKPLVFVRGFKSFE